MQQSCRSWGCAQVKIVPALLGTVWAAESGTGVPMGCAWGQFPISGTCPGSCPAQHPSGPALCRAGKNLSQGSDG